MSKKPTHSLRFMVMLAFTSIGLLFSGIFIDRLIDTKTTLDDRSQAAPTSSTPSITVKTHPTNPVKNEQMEIQFYVNTGDYDSYGVEMRNLKITSDNNLALPNSLIQQNISTLDEALLNKVESNSINYLSTIKNLNSPFTTNKNFIQFARLTFTPKESGKIKLDFDPNQTIVNEFNNPTNNIISQVSDVTITVNENKDCTNNNDVCDENGCAYNKQKCDEIGIGGGGDGDGDDEEDEESECKPPYPPQELIARSGSKPGEINVFWVRPGDHKHFGVSFGRYSGEYKWGDVDIGNTRNFTIRFLEPGAKYYIALITVNDCGASAYSQEISAIARAYPVTYTPPTNPTPTPQPEVVIPSPSPTPELDGPVFDDTEEQPENKSFIGKILDSNLLILILGLVAGLIAFKLFKKDPKDDSL
ncbi:fibronectin type III domain-containing protein [Patescibacteria group bacterium]